MRTTVELDPDTAKAVERMRREEGKGVSEAVNELMRRGMLTENDRPPFVQRTRSLGISIGVSNVADALDYLEGPARSATR
ncbi:MAG: ribbon-helix-helix protein, CopG family [Tetrasphaera sp.]